MVLAGLVIAMGEVVDDAIIDVENIVRRLRLNRAAGQPAVAVPGGARRLARSPQRGGLRQPDRDPGVPAGLLPRGLAGSFFRPLALAYVLAILASLLVALTVTPALSLMLLTGATERRRESPLVRGAEGDLPRDPAAGRAPAGLGGASCWSRRSPRRAGTSPGLGEEFLPNFQETDFLMHLVEKPARRSRRCGGSPSSASKELRTIAGRPQLRLAHRPGRGRRRGRRAELHRALDQRRPQGRPRQDDGARSRRRSTATPACNRDVLTYLKERIKEVLTGAGATMVVRIFGPDMDVLRDKAQEVAQGDGRGSPGVTEPEGRAAGARAAARRPAPPRGRRPARPDPRRRPPRGDHAGQGDEGRRGLPRPEDLRRRRLGRRAGPQRRRRAAATCRSRRRWARTSRSATWPTSRSCRRPTRSSARAPRGGST